MDESGTATEFGAYIGRTVVAEDIVTAQLVNRFRACFAPHLAPAEVAAVPPCLHWCLAPDAAPGGELGSDGHPAKGKFLPPIPLPRRMWAGGETETLDALRVNDKVTRTSRIASVSRKEGRSGTLCFVVLRHEFATDRGLAIRERQDLVYREPSAPGQAATPRETPESAPSAAARLCWTVEPDPVLLFRYSALTFNGHRIHYDLPYARDVEGYPGLVVHGPLQATLLFNMATVLGGRVPRRFTHRGVAPLTAPNTLQAEAIDAGHLGPGALECRVSDPLGRVTMRAEAIW